MKFSHAAITLVLCLVVTAPAVATPAGNTPIDHDRVVGNRGELLQLRSGTYGELFAEGTEASTDASVLALDVTLGSENHRLLVPGTEGFLPETSTRLIHDESSGVSYLLWESLVNGIHPLIHLVAWDGESWSEVREITGSVFSDKGHPQLIVTRDSYDLGEGERFDRTVLHVFWWEEGGDGVEKRYAPVVIENGSFLETQVVRDLSTFFADGSAFGPGIDPNAEGLDGVGGYGWGLEKVVRLQPGPKAEATVLGFLDPRGTTLTSLQIEVLPQELSRLAGQIEAAVDSLPENAAKPAIEQAIQRTLEEAGGDFLPGTLEVLLQDLIATLLDHDPAEDARGLREKLGARAVIVGMKMGANGLEDQRPTRLVEIERDGDFIHHLEITHVAAWPVPPEVVDGEAEGVRLFLSRSGASALVASPSEEGVSYRVTLDDGSWSEPALLTLGEALDLDGAMALLERKALAR